MYDIVVVTDSAVVTMTGGEINGGLFLYNTSTVNISGGDFNSDIGMFHSCRMNMSGGNLSNGKYLRLYNNSSAKIDGTTQLSIVYTYDSSTMTFENGYSSHMSINNSSYFNMTGGEIKRIEDYSNSIANIYGGIITTDIVGLGSSTIINIYGGMIPKIRTYATPQINIYGTGLSKSTFGGCSGFGELIGTLNDSTPTIACFGTDDAHNYVFLINGGTPPPICITHPIGDLNYDCVVDLIDFYTFASSWLECGFEFEADCP